MRRFLEDLRAFGIKADQWTTTAQAGPGGMAQDGGTRGVTFHGEMDRRRESQGWTTACCSMPERDRREQWEDSPKQACSCWFARHSYLAISGANLYPPGVLVCRCFSLALRMFCFRLFASMKPRPFVQPFFDMHAPRQPHVVLPSTPM